jgi:erythromycin esterase
MRNLFLASALTTWLLAIPAWAQPAPALPPDMAPATAEEERAALQWLKASGKAFDPSAYGEADLAPITAILGKARIIGIGEATHGAHQDQSFKAELIKQLVREGRIQALVLEANRDAGRRFDRYVRLGEGDPAELMRSGSFFRIWKDDEFGGLLLWLRNWNLTAANKIRVIGIDNQDAGRDSEFALAFVARFDPAAAARLRSALGSLLPVRGAQHGRFIDWYLKAPKDEAARAAGAALALRDWFEKAPPKVRADASFVETKWAAETARQAFAVFEFDRDDADKAKADIAYYMRRDRFMAENALGMLGDAERAAIWAHNEHVIKELPKVALDMGVIVLGTVIHDRLGENYATVGFTWSQGAFRASKISGNAPTTSETLNQSLDPVALPNNRPGEYGYLFDQTGAQAMWIDMSTRPHGKVIDAWAKRPYWRGSAGWGVSVDKWQVPDPDTGNIPVDAAAGFDVNIWFRTISPSRLWQVK